ncbi:hypothetical protein KAR91_19955 [Candidatus Pacearchaeota archaeon]|nr:hypothetical protein [Candidatus Pacearchaeota archaeon]
MLTTKEWICDDSEHIAEMIEYWQPRLGISDWTIDLEVKQQIDVHNDGVAATNFLLSRRQGWVELSRSDSRSENSMKDDQEMSLVHELLHIIFAAWHDSTRAHLTTSGVEYDVCCEQPIDQLAETLVLMRRSSGHKFSFESEASE